jgi:hypothetical protein
LKNLNALLGLNIELGKLRDLESLQSATLKAISTRFPQGAARFFCSKKISTTSRRLLQKAETKKFLKK